MSEPDSKKTSAEASLEPAWGKDSWPRLNGELDEGDRSLLDAMLRRTPAERLRYLEEFVNGWRQVKRAERLPSD